MLHHCAKIETEKKSSPNNKCVSKFLALALFGTSCPLLAIYEIFTIQIMF